MPWFGLIFWTLCFLRGIDSSTFNNKPGTVWLQENYDGVHNVWGISATCYVRYTYGYTCYARTYVSCGRWGLWRCTAYRAYTCYAHNYIDVSCNVCYINSDSSGHFEMSGKTVQKKSCVSPYCGPTCSATGCLNGGQSFSIGVTCYRTGYETNGLVSTSFTVAVSSANGPSFYFARGSSIEISHDDYGVGGVINTIVPSTADNGDDYDYARYKQTRAPGRSYLHQTADLFYLDTGTGQIKVGKDLTYEFSYFFDMEVCVYDRRLRQVCHQLDIKLWACFQTPNCTNQEEWSLHDVYGTWTGHGGSSNLVFSQIYPQPSGHFKDSFSSTWHKLTWTFDYNQFSDFSAIDVNTGDISITKNISIWPSWPTKDFRARARVANRESCYTTTCDFFIRVHYTNWPIVIVDQQTTFSQNEDDDREVKHHDLIVYDYNYELEDNMTCYIKTISPNEENLFTLRHDGRYKWNSYTLYKEVCQNPDCGYKHPPASDFTHEPWQRFYCDTNIGCLTHNRTQQYTITIKCDDAYNTTAEKDFTFNVIKNQAPVYRNLPNRIFLDIQKTSLHDNIFEIMYWDNERENLIYEYTYEEINTRQDPDYFVGSTGGNYYDNLGNITMTKHLWDKEANNTYIIEICGHERRNENCKELTVEVEEYCSVEPSCNSTSVTVDTTAEMGVELFDMSTLVNSPGNFHALSYSIKAQQGDMFNIDPISGKVILMEKFPEVYPDQSYSIVGYVYNSGACDRGTCQLTVNVNFVNYPIQITNDISTRGSIHEDTTIVKTLLTVTTSDENTDASYTCAITSTNNGPFYLERSPPKTGSYYVKNRKNVAIPADPQTYNIDITCSDLHGSSDTFTLPIDITPNDAPVFTSFTNASHINVNIQQAEKNDVIYSVSATDKEGDTIKWSCSIDTNMNPLACKKYASYVEVYLRRALVFDRDNGTSESVIVCIGDAKHPNSSCADLIVNFSLDLTAPTISNTATWPLSISESTVTGTVIYTATVNNPDTRETETITMNVYPETYTSYFQLNQILRTLNLTLVKQLDYEIIKQLRFEFTVEDSYLVGPTYTLFLNVTNVNEGNTLTIEHTSISFPENTAVNSKLADLGLSCTDIDGDNLTLTVISGYNSDYFSLDDKTGELTLVKEWDLESNIGESTSLIIQCADPDGLTSTAVVEITVTDVNEFEPLCRITFILSNPLSLGPATSLFTVLLTIECSDPDRDSGNDFSASPLGLGIASKYFRVVQRSKRKRSTGNSIIDVKLNKAVDFKNDKSFQITIQISDTAGTPLLTGIVIDVNATAADPDDKSKESTRCLTCTTNGQAIIGVIVVEGVVIVLFVVHAFCSMMCHHNKVLRLRDFDTSRNKRFVPPSKKDTSSKVMTNAFEKSAMPYPGVVPSVKSDRTGSSPQRKGNHSGSSSSSSSSDDSDGDQPPRQEIGRGKFFHKPVVPSMLSLGLPPPIYGSGTGVGRPGLPTSTPVGFGPGTQQPTGLPSPVYSSRVNSQSSSQPGFFG